MVFGTPHVYEHFFTICSLCSIHEPFSTLETPVREIEMQMNLVNQMHFEFIFGLGGNFREINLQNVLQRVAST